MLDSRIISEAGLYRFLRLQNRHTVHPVHKSGLLVARTNPYFRQSLHESRHSVKCPFQNLTIILNYQFTVHCPPNSIYMDG